MRRQHACDAHRVALGVRPRAIEQLAHGRGHPLGLLLHDTEPPLHRRIGDAPAGAAGRARKSDSAACRSGARRWRPSVRPRPSAAHVQRCPAAAKRFHTTARAVRCAPAARPVAAETRSRSDRCRSSRSASIAFRPSATSRISSGLVTCARAAGRRRALGAVTRRISFSGSRIRRRASRWISSVIAPIANARRLRGRPVPPCVATARRPASDTATATAPVTVSSGGWAPRSVRHGASSRSTQARRSRSPCRTTAAGGAATPEVLTTSTAVPRSSRNTEIDRRSAPAFMNSRRSGTSAVGAPRILAQLDVVGEPHGGHLRGLAQVAFDLPPCDPRARKREDGYDRRDRQRDKERQPCAERHAPGRPCWSGAILCAVPRPPLAPRSLGKSRQQNQLNGS